MYRTRLGFRLCLWQDVCKPHNPIQIIVKFFLGTEFFDMRYLLKSFSCSKSNNIFVEYSIGYAIRKGEVIMRS